MTQHTKAHLAFKGESERLTNLVVLFSHAVPVLRRVVASADASALVRLKPTIEGWDLGLETVPEGVQSLCLAIHGWPSKRQARELVKEPESFLRECWHHLAPI